MEGGAFFTAFTAFPLCLDILTEVGYICPRFLLWRQFGKTTGSQLTSHKTLMCCCVNTWTFGFYHFGLYSNPTENCRRPQPLELPGTSPSPAPVAKIKKMFIMPHAALVHWTLLFGLSLLSTAKHLLQKKLWARLSNHGLMVISFWHKAALEEVEGGLLSFLLLTAWCCHLLCPSKGEAFGRAGSGNHRFY